MNHAAHASNDTVLGVLALELQPAQAHPVMAAMGQAHAGELAAWIAQDLAKLVPAVAQLDVVLAAAHFDPAEILRRGWPVHRRLHELQRRAPGRNSGPRIIGFGADAQGDVPMPLQCDASLRGGALRVLPWLLTGDATVLDDVASQLEDVLFERGMAGAASALLAQETLGARIEHARLMTAHDLAAMMAMQFQHQGLDAVWQVIRTALFEPDAMRESGTPPEPPLLWRDAQAHMPLMSAQAWRAYDRTLPEHADAALLDRRHALFEARQRQYAAILQAHGIDVVFDYADV